MRIVDFGSVFSYEREELVENFIGKLIDVKLKLIFLYTLSSPID